MIWRNNSSCLILLICGLIILDILELNVIYIRIIPLFCHTPLLQCVLPNGALFHLLVLSFHGGSISVMDADITLHKNLGSLKTDLIGATSFDAIYVYFNEVSTLLYVSCFEDTENKSARNGNIQ